MSRRLRAYPAIALVLIAGLLVTILVPGLRVQNPGVL
jgi:hypothetical protein